MDAKEHQHQPHRDRAPGEPDRQWKQFPHFNTTLTMLGDDDKRETNRVPRGDSRCTTSAFSIIRNPSATDPQRRYKMAYLHVSSSGHYASPWVTKVTPALPDPASNSMTADTPGVVSGGSNPDKVGSTDE